MTRKSRLRAHTALGALTILGAAGLAGRALADYHPINPTMAGTTITLTGNTLTIDQVAQIARFGAKVQVSPEAKQREADTWGLMIEAATEGMSIYLFNRGAGAQREIQTFTGDPLSEANKAYFDQRDRAPPPFQAPPPPAAGAPINPNSEELSNEDVSRAIMVATANIMTYLPISPPVLQAVVDMLNADVTPVIRARGGTGEAQGPAPGAITNALRGGGEAYYHGVRMSAADALAKAGLKPTQFVPGDATNGNLNTDIAGMGALLVYDAKQLLDWVDLAYAMDLNGMNSSITPLFSPVQGNRPYRWINWDASRVLGMIKGSYLFNDDGNDDPKLKRIIQDPESMRAGYVRQGAAWQAWGQLKDDVTIQMNWSMHNPAVRPGVSPKDSWELSTPWAMKYHVKGGKESNGKEGYVFSNANWDPFPIGNSLEAFVIALANMDVSVMLRQERFNNTFFTVVTAQEVLGQGAGGGRGGGGRGGGPAGAPGGGAPGGGGGGGGAAGGGGGGGGNNHETYQRIQGLMNPVPPEGYSSDAEGVEELDAETLFKMARAERAVLESWTLVANDVNTGARWMDVRKAQDQKRAFGDAPTAALAALRNSKEGAYTFIRTTPAATFYPNGPATPDSAEPAVRSVLAQSKPVKKMAQ